MSNNGTITSYHSPGKIYNVGHGAVADIFTDSVLIEEKIDGSFFQFGRFGNELKVRSKSAQLDPESPEKMFTKAVDAAKSVFEQLHDGWTYRGEFLQKPKHNSLAYDRTPLNNVIIFDICTAEEVYLSYDEKKAEAERLGFEVVPRLFEGIANIIDIQQAMDVMSVLGGQKIEGVVIKRYDLFTKDGKAKMAKHVSEAFKEVHKKEWKVGNPNSGDIVDALISTLKTPARWNKAIQHLKEAGQLENSPKDIGLLINEIKRDTIEEERELIQKTLLDWALPRIERGIVGGVAEYYKTKLLEGSFNNE